MRDRSKIQEGRRINYRGAVLIQAWGGHWNVFDRAALDDGGTLSAFCGGFRSIAAAKRFVNGQTDEGTSVMSL